MSNLIFAGVLSAALLMASPLTASALQTPAPATARAGVVDLNAATIADLESLPGVGRRTAERIIEYRQKSGGFKKIEELMNVKGIGEKSFLRIKPMVAVSPRPEKAGGPR